MQTEHTLHPIVATDQYHFDLPIKKSLTQALGPKLPAIVEEGKLAIDQYIGFAKGEYFGLRQNHTDVCDRLD